MRRFPVSPILNLLLIVFSHGQPMEAEEASPSENETTLLPMERLRRAFGRNDYLLPENFKTLRRSDIPVTYRLHDDLLRYYSLNFNDAVKMQSNNDLRVNHTGHIRQVCTLLFGSWAHSNDSIKYSLYTQNLSLIDFYDNQEWELDMGRSTVKTDGFLYDYLDPPLFWEMIIIDLVVSRQSFYYVFNLVIPSTIITLVAVIGFHTPSTSGRVRDAKFRLGIMTLMSMSVILLAIVEDMPKFSMSNNRKGRGSFSGIPLIGLYYFILLAIIGLSTVTTSMFVFLERDVRVKHAIPWYLRWLAFDVHTTKISRSFSQYRRQAAEQQASAMEPLLSNGHVQSGIRNKARGVAASLLTLFPRPPSAYDNNNAYQLHSQPQPEATPPRDALRRRMSLTQYDNMIIYQYFEQVLEDLIKFVSRIEKLVGGIRQELVSLVPQDDLNSKWQTVIRRLEILSLVFYVSVLFVTMYLFFYHDWYCAFGHNPCGQVNLKCPWMAVTPDDPQCEHNSYN